MGSMLRENVNGEISSYGILNQLQFEELVVEKEFQIWVAEGGEEIEEIGVEEQEVEVVGVTLWQGLGRGFGEWNDNETKDMDISLSKVLEWLDKYKGARKRLVTESGTINI